MRFGAARGILRVTPLAGAGIIVATLSTGSLPLLAGFPSRLALWEGLSRDSIGAALWMAIGIAGLLTSAFRSLAVISMADEYTGWTFRETPTQMTMLGLGMLGLFLLGLFPQTVQFSWQTCPSCSSIWVAKTTRRA